MKRRIVAVIVLLGLLASGAAMAAWNVAVAPESEAAVAATRVPTATAPTVVATGTRSVSLTWAPVTLAGGAAATGYDVHRVATGGGTPTPVCTSPVTGTSCVQNDVPDGSWTWTVTARYATWQGQPSPPSTPLAVPVDVCVAPPNEIAAENCRPGNPSSEWDVSGAGDPTLQGYTTDQSVDQGSLVQFKVDVDVVDPLPAFRIDVYRLGWYNGAGARKVATIPSTATTSTNQLPCIRDVRGVADCGNWLVSAGWNVPVDAPSGLYIGRLVREDTGGASHVAFVVRDDDGGSDVVMQTSDTTWQAYNQYGGASLYGGDGPGGGASPNRAYAVSYNRPITTRAYAPEDWIFNAEYPMLRWLERNGYDVSYISGVDTDRAGAELLDHNAFLSVGHDEYWSGTQRANVEAARDAGVNLAFFSGNEMFWKTRWETSIDGAGTPHRTLVSYKETHENAKIDPSPEWTGTWRDNRSFNPAPDPENATTGTIFTVNCCDAVFRVPAEEGRLRLWRNTSIATQADGATAELPAGYVGYEWDEDLENGFRPAGLVRMSETNVAVPQRILDQGSSYGPGAASHALVLHRAGPANALVFGAGTVQWSWGLDGQHDRSGPPADLRLQQATVNLFADMGVQPSALRPELTPASQTTDTVAPTTTVTPPTVTPQVGVAYTVTGTVTDTGGGRVGGVEVSTDGGLTWRRATGRGTWSHTFTPSAVGPLTVQARSVDDSANLGPWSTPVALTVGARTCPCSVWDDSVVPPVVNVNDTGSVELGVKFRASVDGWITGVRFYKGPLNTGSHTGNLWSATGTNLGSVTFSGESASGWQTATFASPVAVTANTTYVASYHAPNGYYAASSNYFATGVDAPPLRLLANGEDGPNGVYLYGAGGFPTATFQASNYWVDVVFATSIGPDTTAPQVTVRTPAPGATGVAANTPVTATFSEPIDAATLSASTVRLRAAGATEDAPATVAYSGPTRTVTLQPNAPLAFSTTYTATLAGTITDVAGNPLGPDVTWTFTTAAPPPVEGPGGPVLLVTSAADPFDSYYAEILRAEGLNAFTMMDVALVNTAVLANHRAVLLAANGLTAPQATMFADWVDGGGDLVAMRPDAQLASLLGLSPAGGDVTNGYLRIDPVSTVGAGLVDETIQFKGTADRYTTLPGTETVATLYTDATTSTANPAVSRRSVGVNGGSAASFSYDLARTVVLLRQGNPAWVNQNRDGQAGPNRSDDLFYGAAAFDPQPDWVDLAKVAIPQADEQQRLLANLLVDTTRDAQPLPRFWYLPRGEKAAIVLTADEHNGGDPETRLNAELAQSPANCDVDDWACVRSTSYLYPEFPSTFTAAEAQAYEAQGFEIALHVNTGCQSYTRSQYRNALDTQIPLFLSRFGVTAPTTNRNHCISWSDWTIVPEEQAASGIRLDTNYYYWPPGWVNDTPGLFTGSGLPMRFAKTDGTSIDAYQAATQMTDESGQSYPSTAISLMDRALGAEGYYGTFVTNFHTDFPGSGAIEAGVVAAAQARGVPLISAAQLLEWVDGRNASTFDNMVWNDQAGTLTFDIGTGVGANGLEAMLPLEAAGGTLTGLTRNGSTIPKRTETVKGIDYAVFAAGSGPYVATYAPDTTAPVITDRQVTTAPNSATITWTTDETSTSVVDYGLTAALGQQAATPGSSTAHTVTLTGLTPGTTYQYVARSTDGANNTVSSPSPGTATFTTPSAQVIDTTSSDFGAGTPAGTYVTGDGGVTLAPTVGAEFDGTVLPPGWEARTTPWTLGGLHIVAGGALTVDGTAVKTTAASNGDLSLEFTATFGAATFQNIGLTGDVGADDFVSPWATFGTDNTADGVRARTNAGTSVLLGADLLGSPHRYRITRTAAGVEWWVDGLLRHTDSSNAALNTTALRPVVSDVITGGPTLQVDWVRMAPYSATGTFTSRVLSAGGPADWGTIGWDADLPAGTALTMRVRTGNTPVPGASWSAFAPVSNNTSVTQSGRYAQYEATLSSAGAAVTPTLQAVRLSYVLGTDSTPPTITGRVPAPNAIGVAIGTGVAATFDEPINGSTVTSASFRLSPAGVGSPVAAMVAYDALSLTATLTPVAPLAAGTVYDVVVDATVADLAGNPLAAADTWSFTTAAATLPPAQVVDTTAADFGAGTRASTYVSDTAGGEVTLAPTVGAEFAGTGLPGGWSAKVNPWAPGGAAPVAGGSVSVDGTMVGTTATFGPGRSLEFEATFSAQRLQHVGFVADLAFNDPWAIVSSGDGSGVFARTTSNPGGVSLGAGLLGSSHRYRIDWTATGFDFWVDGSFATTIPFATSGPMLVGASDFDLTTPLVVDWLRMTPYASPGTFLSRVHSAGGPAADWGNLSYVADVPSDTTLGLEVRTGETPIPDGTWSAFAPINSGQDVATSGRYLQYRVTATSSTGLVTPTLESVTLPYTATADTTAPTITGRSPAPGAIGVAVGTGVTVAFDEPMNASTVTSTSFRLTPAGGVSPVAATVTYDALSLTATLTPVAPLAAATVYDVVVDATVADLAGNPLVASTWSFTTAAATLPPAPTITDTTDLHFMAGTRAGVAIAGETDGELILTPTVQEEFAGTTVPGGWTSTPWTGGGSTIAGGVAVVDGARLATDTTYLPGSSLEFVATIGGAAFQNIGFGQTLEVGSEFWAMFGTAGTSSTLYARTNLNGSMSDVAIPGSFIGTPHRYRIDWLADSVVYSIDGTVVHTAAATIPVPLRIVASDYQSGPPALVVDWMRLSPYGASGTFESRVIDGGAPVRWTSLGWDAVVPAGTSATISVRTGDTPTPDATWTPWSTPSSTPGPIDLSGRYVQYAIVLTTTDDRFTPTIRSVTVG